MFNLYFAGWGHKSADEYLQRLHKFRLFSYANEQSHIIRWDSNNCGDILFVDSGAFSVAHSGVEIDIDEYIAFINSHTDINVFVELDKIPYPVLTHKTAYDCSEKSWKNYLYMKERVQSKHYILPVFHFGEPKESLKRILNTRINGELVKYIAIGGRHGVAMDAQIRYFNDIFKIIKNSDNPDVKVHGLGIATPKLLERFPFYSADSTTWLQLAISGCIVRKDLSNICVSKSVTDAYNNINCMPKYAVDILEKEVAEFGYTLDELSVDYRRRLCYNIDIFCKWAAEYEYRGGGNKLNSLF